MSSTLVAVSMGVLELCWGQSQINIKYDEIGERSMECPSSSVHVRLPLSMTIEHDTHSDWVGPPSGWYVARIYSVMQ